ncbi:MAG: hypothetical protein HYZ00_08110, partial [Candidatus Hydrogenedentes bacterium]|nr:hypothetical protein [Candidatus Hydrogenedentota bacterium]
FTLGREACCPRPREMAYIHGIYAASSDGFVSYSDGSHDDLNKAVWSALAWDPDMPVEQIVREYSEVHFGEEIAETAAQGLVGLERNWQGPVEANEGIAKTLELWRSVNQAVGGAPQNWRLQMYTLRALYDRYVQERFIAEARYEVEALDALRQTPDVKQAVADARKALAQVDEHPPAPEIRKEIEVLGKQLFKSIGYQLSIKPPYLASNAERGAVLDYLDQPLNERSWIEARLTEIEKEDDPAKQQAMIREIVDWENPGPGGAYDDLGNIRKQPHLVRQMPIEQDPGGLCSPRVDFGEPMNRRTLELTDARLSWMDVAETLYATPLQVRYEGLDPNAQYRLRATYTGRYKASLRLTADGQYEIHPVLPQPTPVKPVEFTIPKAATADGVLDLEWRRESGRGCQVSELWLLRE